MTKKISKSLDHEPLLTDIQHLINQSRQKVALTVNAELTTLYWKIGHRINVEILKDSRAEYRQFIIEVTPQVVDKFGFSLTKTYLRHPERSEGSPEFGSVPGSLRSFATLRMTYLGSYSSKVYRAVFQQNLVAHFKLKI
jgi:hypothetical protein